MLLRVLILYYISAVDISSAVYYGFTGYTRFPVASDVLTNAANQSISFEVKFCQMEGVFLYATDQEFKYFAIGIFQSRFLIQFDFGNGLREV